MLRYQIRALRTILQPNGFFSVTMTAYGKSSAAHSEMLSDGSQGISKSTKPFQPITEKSENFVSDNSQEYLRMLKVYKFEDSLCFKMLEKYPDLVQIPLNNFRNSLQQWFNSQLDTESYHQILYTHPNLLEVTHDVIIKRLPHLHFVCGSPKFVTKLLINCPCVMYDDWNTVCAKINYLLKFRRFNVISIIESYSLSQSLDFIKFRFGLLKKCGIYKQQTLPIHKINKYDKSQHKNPSLNDILLENNKFFSTKIAKISLEEYNMCYDWFMADEAEFLDEDHSDDDDDDDDDD